MYIKSKRRVIMEIKVENLNEQLAAVIPATTTQQELGIKLGQSFGEIMQFLGQNGQQPVGAPFVAYYNLDPSNLQVEFGFPIAAELSESGDVKIKKVPGGKIVTAIHKGSYAKLGETYQVLTEYMKQEKIEPAMLAYEYYLNNVAEVPEDELLTKIVFYTK